MLRRGFTLIEILIVVVVMAILAVALVPAIDPQYQDQAESVARMLAADLGYARSLAVANGSKYRVTFDLSNNRYMLTHSGTNAALDVLPPVLFRKAGDPPTQYIVRLAELPRLGLPVSIEQVVRIDTALEPAGEVEFGPLGGTTDTRPTVVVLTTGQGDKKHRFLVVVNPVTGLTSIGADAASLASVIPSGAIAAVDTLGK